MDNKNKFLLTVDIGNTLITAAVFQGSRIAFARSISTGSVKDFMQLLKATKARYPKLCDAVLCSVVPRASKKIFVALKRELYGKVFVCGQNFKIPIKNNYRNPKQVGQDRLACAFAAKTLYGLPAIVIDFGTALTIDVVSVKGAYEGGMIIPGIKLSLKALAEHTALLPQINFHLPQVFIGRTTEESIVSGMANGYAALIDGVVKKIKKQLGAGTHVVLTGGYGKLMSKALKPSVDKSDPYLIFKGLMLAYYKFFS